MTSAIIITIAGIVGWLYFTSRREEGKRAEMVYYNRQAAPILLLPDDPFDEDFADRIERVKSKLKESGNQYAPEVIAVPYRAPIGDKQTVNVDFDKYLIMMVAQWTEAREKWAARNYQAERQAAEWVIAGHKARSN